MTKMTDARQESVLMYQMNLHFTEKKIQLRRVCWKSQMSLWIEDGEDKKCEIGQAVIFCDISVCSHYFKFENLNVSGGTTEDGKDERIRNESKSNSNTRKVIGVYHMDLTFTK